MAILLITGHGQFYDIPARLEDETSNAVIIGIIPVCFTPTSPLFNLGSTCFYVLAYFTMDSDSSSEPLAIPIHVSTPIEESLVVDQAYRSYIMTFTMCETWTNLFVLDMIYFDVILFME